MLTIRGTPSLRLASLISATALLAFACSRQPASTQFQAHPDPILAIALGEGVIATSSIDRTVKVWDEETASHVATLNGHSDWVTDLAFDPRHGTLASVGRDGLLMSWSTTSWQQSRPPLVQPQPLSAISYSPSGEVIAIALEDGSIRLLDTSTGEAIATLRPEARQTNSVAFSPDGKTIVASHAGSTPPEISASVWAIPATVRIALLLGHSPSAEALGTTDPNLAQRLLQAGVTWGSVNDASYTPDGALIATAGEDGTLRMWDASTSLPIATRTLGDISLSTVTFDPSGRLVFGGGSNGQGFVWEASSLQQVLALPEQGIELNDAVFTSDGRFLIAAYYDGNVRLWPIPEPHP